MSATIKKLVQRRTQVKKKIFLNLIVFEELSRIEFLCEHGIFDMILFTFSVTILQNKIYSIKKSISKLTFRPQNESIFSSL